MSNNSVIFENVDKTTERILVGLFYIFTATSMIVPYSICMYIIGTEKKFRGIPFYRIALFMGIMDIGQLTCNGLYAGFSCLVPFEMPYMVQKVNSSLLCMGWFTYTMLTHILAVNRFVTVFWPDKVDEIFSYKVTSILIGVSFLHGGMWFGMYMWPDVDESFSTEDYGFVFDFTKSKSMLAVQMVAYEDYFHSACMIMWYTLVYIKLRLNKSQIIDQAIAQNNKKERKVLLQSVVLCSMDIATIAGYLIIQLVPHSRWTAMIANYIWLFCAGNCSLIYLTLNSLVRARFLKIFCKNRIVPVVSTVDAPQTVAVRHDPTTANAKANAQVITEDCK